MSEITLNLSPALQAHRSQDVDTCLEEITPILKYVPHHPVALHLKAWAHSKKGESKEALEILSNVIENNPRLVPAKAEYGSILMANRRHAEALQYLKEAHELQPEREEVTVKYCVCLNRTHQFGEAERLLRDLLERSPNHFNARFLLAIALLNQGKWDEGFEHYQIRFWLRCMGKIDCLHDQSVEWAGGQDLEGKTLLIQCEQGYGDQIMFIRYAQWIKNCFFPEKVIVQADPELKELLEATDAIDEVVSHPSECRFDQHVPLLNLPMLHGTTPETIPYAPDAYLRVPDSKAELWKDLFEEDEKQRIGFCWRTNLINSEISGDIDREKEIKSLGWEEAEVFGEQVKAMFPAAEIISLQPGASMQEQQMMARVGITDIWKHPIKDFADTAAVIDRMDLVVSIDTAVAHLAGALGKPVWNLLPHAADWRWSQDGEFSNWYPNMRLFRQGEEDDWLSLDCD